jgi:hypothetical protein
LFATAANAVVTTIAAAGQEREGKKEGRKEGRKGERDQGCQMSKDSPTLAFCLFTTINWSITLKVWSNLKTIFFENLASCFGTVCMEKEEEEEEKCDLFGTRKDCYWKTRHLIPTAHDTWSGCFHF